MSEPDPIPVPVPLLDATLVPPPKDRVRALKRHLIRSLRALREAKRPDRLIQKTAPVPAGGIGRGNGIAIGFSRNDGVIQEVCIIAGNRAKKYAISIDAVPGNTHGIRR